MGRYAAGPRPDFFSWAKSSASDPPSTASKPLGTRKRGQELLRAALRLQNRLEPEVALPRPFHDWTSRSKEHHLMHFVILPHPDILTPGATMGDASRLGGHTVSLRFSSGELSGGIVGACSDHLFY